jgi:ketosteroid isomerase-like protein
MRSWCCGISADAITPAEVRDGKLARAQMFYFDPLAAAEFLAGAGADA